MEDTSTLIGIAVGYGSAVLLAIVWWVRDQDRKNTAAIEAALIEFGR